jgi:hypothetical protein
MMFQLVKEDSKCGLRNHPALFELPPTVTQQRKGFTCAALANQTRLTPGQRWLLEPILTV